MAERLSVRKSAVVTQVRTKCGRSATTGDNNGEVHAQGTALLCFFSSFRTQATPLRVTTYGPTERLLCGLVSNHGPQRRDGRRHGAGGSGRGKREGQRRRYTCSPSPANSISPHSRRAHRA